MRLGSLFFVKTVGILVLDQVFDSAFSLTHDVLRMGAQMAKGDSGFLPFTLQIICVGKKRITTGSGQQILADITIQDGLLADVIVIPGLELFDGQSMNASLGEKIRALLLGGYCTNMKTGAALLPPALLHLFWPKLVF